MGMEIPSVKDDESNRISSKRSFAKCPKEFSFPRVLNIVWRKISI